MIHRNLPFEEYQKLTGINQSALKHFERSPAHAREYIENGQPETEPMKIGKLVHAQILEPDSGPLKTCVVKPDGMKFNTTVGKTWQAEQLALGKTIIDDEQDKLIFGALPRISKHAYVSRILAFGDSELSLTADLDGMPCKCRVDHLVSNTIADIKVVEDARMFAFQRDIEKRGLHIQAACYMDIANSPENRPPGTVPIECFVWIAIEKHAPFEMACWQLESEDIERGRNEYRKLLNSLKNCQANSDWPGYEQVLKKIGLPEWRRRRDPDTRSTLEKLAGIPAPSEANYFIDADSDVDEPEFAL